jgi:hypothetical protein
MSFRVTHDLTKLTRFAKEISGASGWAVRVGIFSDKSPRKDGDEMDNAAVGLQHELGVISRRIPIRSWLTMPLRVTSAEIVREVAYAMKDKLAHFGIPAMLKDLGYACEKAIEDAFHTSGFGTWQALKPATVRRKMAAFMKKHPGFNPAEHTNEGILVDTGQLRRSVASKVVKA